MKIKGWTLLFHPLICGQMQKLARAAQKAEARGDHSNANIKLFDQVLKHVEELIPEDPSSERFRQGNTLGKTNRHWRRAKFGGRFRLFYRYDSSSKLIAFAWVNDANTKRKAGAKTDPYEIFKAMIASGNPPGDFQDLVDECQANWQPNE